MMLPRGGRRPMPVRSGGLRRGGPPRACGRPGRPSGLPRSIPPVAAATAGAVCISSSAVLMKLADASPSITALGRCAFALPVLGVLAWAERRRGAPRLPSRSRWLAGLVLVGGLADVGGSRAYGTNPGLGVVYGAAVAIIYAAYILTLRQSTSP